MQHFREKQNGLSLSYLSIYSDDSSNHYIKNDKKKINYGKCNANEKVPGFIQGPLPW